MIIKKLNATFGILENRELEFHDGLNIIEAPNESGKTTWCAFISAMLYGLPGNERKKTGFIPDRTKYVPRSGALMSGSMEIDTGKDCITIERSSKTNKQPFSEFSACHTDTKINIYGMTGENCGEKLTGVTRDVFRRTAFVPQGYVAGVSGGGVEDKIRSVVTTGEEDVSFSLSEERLNTWLRERKFNNKGTIAETEELISQTKELIDNAKELNDEKDRTIDELEELKKKKAALETEINDKRKQQRKKSLAMLTEVKDETSMADREIKRLTDELADAKEQLRNYNFILKDRQSLVAFAKKDINTLSYLEQEDLSNSSISRHIIGAILLLLAAMAIMLVYLKIDFIGLPIAAILMAALAVFFTVAGLLKYTRVLKRRTLRNSILEKYGVTKSRDVFEVLKSYSDTVGKIEELKDNLADAENYRGELEERRAKVEKEVLSALEMVDGNNTAASLNRDLQLLKEREQELKNTLSAIEGKLSALPDISSAEITLENLTEKKERLEGDYNSIKMALDVLKESNTELSGRFSPILGEKASEYLSYLTGGRYTRVRVDEKLSLDVKKDGDINSSEPETLSAGTLDQTYLAVRLAVCAVALKAQEPCPLVIDDALVNFDGERYDKAIELLGEIAKERQVILFTCRGT